MGNEMTLNNTPTDTQVYLRPIPHIVELSKIAWLMHASFVLCGAGTAENNLHANIYHEQKETVTQYRRR